MTGHRRTTARRAAIGLVCVVTVMLAAPALANASYGFDIVNRTGSTLKLESINTSPEPPFEVVGGIEQRPSIGHVLGPNAQPMSVELRDDANVQANLIFVDQNGQKWEADTASYLVTTNSRAHCHVPDQQGRCEVADGRHPTIRFFDPPGTQRTVAGADAQKQMNLLNDLCKDGRAGECSFASRDAKPIDTYAPAAVVGQPVLNCGDTSAEDSYTFADTQESTNSVGAKFAGSVEWGALGSKFAFSFKYTFDYQWGHTKKFVQDVAIPDVLPRHVAYMNLTVPITRQYGTFVAQINNTTWTLQDVRFDSPSQQPAGLPTPSKLENRPATAGELKACEGTTGIVKLRPSAIESLSGNAKSNTLYSASSGGKVLAKAGDDILIGGRGPDRLSGGAGDDNIIGGPGRDVLRGGPGSDTLQDTQGPTTVITGGAKNGLDTVYVRDGHGDDVVHCTSKNSAVIADQGDRVTGPCGHVTRTGAVDRPPL